MATFAIVWSVSWLGYCIAGGVEGWLPPTVAWICGTAHAAFVAGWFARLIGGRR